MDNKIIIGAILLTTTVARAIKGKKSFGEMIKLWTFDSDANIELGISSLIENCH